MLPPTAWLWAFEMFVPLILKWASGLPPGEWGRMGSGQSFRHLLIIYSLISSPLWALNYRQVLTSISTLLLSAKDLCLPA